MKPRRVLAVHPEDPFDGVTLCLFNALIDAGYEVRVVEEPHAPPGVVYSLDYDDPEQMAGNAAVIKFHEGDQN